MISPHGVKRRKYEQRQQDLSYLATSVVQKCVIHMHQKEHNGPKMGPKFLP